MNTLQQVFEITKKNPTPDNFKKLTKEALANSHTSDQDANLLFEVDRFLRQNGCLGVVNRWSLYGSKIPDNFFKKP